MKGKRKTIYVRPAHMWLFRAIEHVKREAAKLHVALTDSDVIIDCMITQLEDYKKSPDVEPTHKSATGRRRGEYVATKKTVTCPDKYSWVFERVEDIVTIKRELGLKASFSSELVALAANGLQSENEYATIVKQMLSQASGDM